MAFEIKNEEIERLVEARKENRKGKKIEKKIGKQNGTQKILEKNYIQKKVEENKKILYEKKRKNPRK